MKTIPGRARPATPAETTELELLAQFLENIATPEATPPAHRPMTPRRFARMFAPKQRAYLADQLARGCTVETLATELGLRPWAIRCAIAHHAKGNT